MNSLLQFAVEAHGGLNRWNNLHRVEADVSIGGALWQLKGRPYLLKNTHVTAELREERISTLLVDSNERLTFEAGRSVVVTRSGKDPAIRNEPRAAFAGHLADTPWDDFHVGYFSNYALWTYLTIPFLFTYPGFVVEELNPWHENGEIWRPLEATFPESIESHTRKQVSYFGPDGLLRRHEYTVDILGGAQGVNYAYDYQSIDGIQIPTRRRIFAFDVNKHKVPSPVLVSIDLTNIRLT